MYTSVKKRWERVCSVMREGRISLQKVGRGMGGYGDEGW